MSREIVDTDDNPIGTVVDMTDERWSPGRDRTG